MKQYLLMVDEVSMAMLSHLLKPNTFQFLAVEGVPLNNDTRYHVIVTPVIPPVPPAETQSEKITQEIADEVINSIE